MPDGDTNAAKILDTIIKHPITGAAMIGAIVLSTTALLSVKNDIQRVNDLVTQDRQTSQELKLRVDKIEEKTTEKLDRMQNDIGDVKATVRGLDANIQGLNRNIEIYIRQNSPTPPR